MCRPFGRRTATALISLALAVGGIGCSGEIGAANRTSGGAAPGGSPTQGGGGIPGAAVDPAVLAALPWPILSQGQPSALRRLTRDELVTSLEMLTGSAPLRADLPEEQRSGHGPLLTTGVSFIGPEMGRLKLAIDNFVAKIAPSMLAKTGCALTQQAQRDCLLAWSLKFAQQALRRAPSSGESTAFQKILSGADGTADADTGALEGALTAIFLGP